MNLKLLFYICIFVFSLPGLSQQRSSIDVETPSGQTSVVNFLYNNISQGSDEDRVEKILYHMNSYKDVSDTKNYLSRERIAQQLLTRIAGAPEKYKENHIHELFNALEAVNIPKPENYDQALSYRRLKLKHKDNIEGLINSLDGTFSDQMKSDIVKQNLKEIAPRDGEFNVDLNLKALKMVSKGEIDQGYLSDFLEFVIRRTNPKSVNFIEGLNREELLNTLAKEYDPSYKYGDARFGYTTLMCEFALEVYGMTIETGEKIISSREKMMGTVSGSFKKSVRGRKRDNKKLIPEHLSNLQSIIKFGGNIDKDCVNKKSVAEMLDVVYAENPDLLPINPCIQVNQLINLNVCQVGEVVEAISSYAKKANKSDASISVEGGTTHAGCEVTLFYKKNRRSMMRLTATLLDRQNKPFVVEAKSQKELILKLESAFKQFKLLPKKSN